MKQLYNDANTLHGYLAKIGLLQHEIGNITRNRLSELQGYSRPPEILQKLMKAVYVIIGENPEDLVSSLSSRIIKNVNYSLSHAVT